MYNKGTWHELFKNEIKKRGLKIYFLVDGSSKANKFNFDSWSSEALLQSIFNLCG
jgi:hypothetical protein